MNFRDLSRNVMARDKVLYEGHAVAAVAVVSPIVAAEAVELIEVEYEPLPYVIDCEEAMAPDAPILHEDMFTQGVEPAPTKASNIAKRVGFKKGDCGAGFAEADVVIVHRLGAVGRCVLLVQDRRVHAELASSSCAPPPSASCRCRSNSAARAHR
jgi:CO/xanthine dehydrogenase Mo-binding subunit